MARAHWRDKHERLRARPIEADTLRRRALDDARGLILREGVTYFADRAVHWLLRRSVRGRVNQVDLVVDGRLLRTTARVHADAAIRWGKWPRAVLLKAAARPRGLALNPLS